MDRYLHTLKRWSQAAVLQNVLTLLEKAVQQPGANVSGYAKNDPFEPEGVL